MPDAGPVLVTGSSGFVGSGVVDELRRHGYAVRSLSRSAHRANSEDHVAADVTNPDGLARAMEGCSAIMHVAGANAFCLPDPSVLYDVNVDGTINVIRAAARAGVPRVVMTSSAATVGEEHGTVGTEQSPHRGSFLSHYERSKWEAEVAAFDEAERLNVDVIAVNPSSVQGPGRVGGTARLLIDYLNGRLRMVVDSRLSIVDIDDCSRGHRLALENGVAGRRYILSGSTSTVSDALHMLSQITGIDDTPRTLRPPVARLLGAAGTIVGRIRRRRMPVCTEMIRTMLHGHSYDGSRAQRELGLRYTPLDETIRRTVAWYVDNGIVTRELPSITASRAE